MADKKIAEQYYSPPPKMGKWEGFKKFIWNSETSQCLGRTGGSWGKYYNRRISLIVLFGGLWGCMCGNHTYLGHMKSIHKKVFFRRIW